VFTAIILEWLKQEGFLGGLCIMQRGEDKEVQDFNCQA
jgi:hypothetical protein